MTEDLLAAFSLGVFERRADGLFDAIGKLPAWLELPAKAVDLADTYPILGIFFAEWEEKWDGISDVWTEPAGDGSEMYLQATAASINRQRFLALKSLPEAMYTYQQLAHDFELEKEKVERLSKELEIKRQEAERATQAKSAFLATMSHEIRTPLNAIIGMADVLAGTTLTGEQRKCVDIFQRHGVNLLTLINDILDLSKVEAGKIELEVTELDLVDVVTRAMEVVEGRASAKGLYLKQAIAPGVPRYLMGDPNRLRQIIINLLGNSIKFTEKGGLEVSVTEDPEDRRAGRLRFRISDTGIGIPADKVDLLFKSFSQVDSSTTRKYGGTGLGLSISKQLVELMGGRIWVESRPGVGSQFYFTANFAVQADQSPREEATTVSTSTEAPETLLSGMRILLADDSEDNRCLIELYVRDAHLRVETAENGAIALRKFCEGHYDVVLMDVEMPEMDGSEATRQIRQFEKETGRSATPVLALTAHAFAEMAAKSMEAGFTGVLTKPIRKATLLEALVHYGGREGIVRAAATPAEPASRETNVVEVEDGMEDAVPGYIENRKAELALYQSALEHDDFDSAKKMAHKMKGTGAGYGMPRLTELGAAIEKASLDKQGGQLRDLVAQLAKYLDNIELKYSK